MGIRDEAGANSEDGEGLDLQVGGRPVDHTQTHCGPRIDTLQTTCMHAHCRPPSQSPTDPVGQGKPLMS